MPEEQRPLRPGERREVLDLAFKLQEEADAKKEAEQHQEGLIRAAEELGLNREHVPLAEGLVRARAEERAFRAVEARNRRLLVGGIAAAAALAVATISAFVLLYPVLTAYDGWSTDFSKAGAEWQLESSSGTQASLSWEEQAGQGVVAKIKVDSFKVMGDGRYWVNLESTQHPDWSGAETVSFMAKGEGLTHVRLYLENGEERWRGPSVVLGPAWQGYTLKLDEFEYQQKQGSQWSVQSYQAPAQVQTTSFKLGWYVNDSAEKGSVWLDNLSVE
jgi:hypothetical protein